MLHDETRDGGARICRYPDSNGDVTAFADAIQGAGPDEATEGIRAQGAPPDYPAAQAYAACLIAQRCLEEAGADDESLWRAACALDCGTFFGRFHIDPATGLQVGHEMVFVQWRRGRKVVVWPPPVSKARPLYPRPASLQRS